MLFCTTCKHIPLLVGPLKVNITRLNTGFKTVILKGNGCTYSGVCVPIPTSRFNFVVRLALSLIKCEGNKKTLNRNATKRNASCVSRHKHIELYSIFRHFV